MDEPFPFLEFFAGAGLARLGLEPKWRALFANDICPKKAACYRRNFNGAPEFRLGDIWDITSAHIAGEPAMAWASFPCQDLSCAGNKQGLIASRSGSFWGFWQVLRQLATDNRKPPLIVCENVTGLLSSRLGGDFAAVCEALVDLGCRVGAIVIDAMHFVPQSRPRLFIIATDQNLIPASSAPKPDSFWHPPGLVRAWRRLPVTVQRRWVWWSLPVPAPRQTALGDIVYHPEDSACWHSPAETERLLALMSERHRDKITAVSQSAAPAVGAVYKRTRRVNGVRMQRAEIRFDGLCGCLRTPSGGSSRQVLLFVHKGRIRSRLLTPREAARLMGADDSYCLPKRYNEAYHCMGDGVAVPAVRWLSDNLLLPLARAARRECVGHG
jgi:DNA (cytosine-5)-methyltransferase 1